MANNDESVLARTLRDAEGLRLKTSRRRFLSMASIAGATAALSSVSAVRYARAAGEDTHGPGWYTDDKLTGSVRLLTFSGQRWGLPSQGVVATFKERFPNVSVQIDTQPISELETKLQLLAASKSTAFDAAWGDAGQWQAFAKVDAMANLESKVGADRGWADDYFKDVPKPITDSYRVPPTAAGVTFGLSPDGNTKLMYYRSDLFDKIGVKEPPKTWDEALEICKALHKPGEDQYGFITTLRRGAYAGMDFYQLVVSYGGQMFDAEEKGGWHPQLNTEFGHSALTMLKKFMEFAHPVTLNAVDDEVNAALANGSAAFAPMTWGTTVLNDEKFTKFYKDFKADIIPKGNTTKSKSVVLRGGYGVFVNANVAKNQQAAFEYIKHLCSADYVDSRIGRDYVENFGQPSRISLLQRFSTLRPHFPALAKSFPVSINYLPTIAESYTLADIIGNEVAAVVTNEKSIENGLIAMQSGAERVMKDGGYY